MLVTKALLSRNFCIRQRKNRESAGQTPADDVRTEVPLALLEEGVASDPNGTGIQLENDSNNVRQRSRDDGAESKDKEFIETKKVTNTGNGFLVDWKAWKEVQSQNPITTCLIFVTNYSLYIINRYIRL